MSANLQVESGGRRERVKGSCGDRTVSRMFIADTCVHIPPLVLLLSIGSRLLHILFRRIRAAAFRDHVTQLGSNRIVSLLTVLYDR